LTDKLLKMQTLPEYLTQKFLDWQATEGARKTLEDFANYLDVNRSLLSYWINGARVPSEENIEKISIKLGNEIYDVLDIPRPNIYLQKLTRIWEFIPEDVQKRLFDEAGRYETEDISKRVSKVSKRTKASRNK